ncbi:hypothetical protein [Endozoicomonas lisbonensis]
MNMIKKWKLPCLLLMSNAVFGYNFEEVTPESFMQGLDQLFTGYSVNPDMVTRYLTGLSHLSSGLVDHPETQKILNAFEQKKSATQCEQYDSQTTYKDDEQTYCDKILNEIAGNYLTMFGLDSFKNPYIAATLSYITPNDKMSLHNHLNNNAVMVVLKGELRSLNFDIVSPERQSKVTVQKNKDMWLREGEVSYFSVARDNLHEIHTAGESAIFLSIYTDISDSYDFDTPKGSLKRSQVPTTHGSRERYDAGWSGNQSQKQPQLLRLIIDESGAMLAVPFHPDTDAELPAQ